MDKKNNLLAYRFFTSLFLFFLFLIFSKPAQAGIFGSRGLFGRFQSKSYSAPAQSYSYSHSESKSSGGQSERSQVSSTDTVRPAAVQNQKSSSQSPRESNLTFDEQKAVESRNQYYDQVSPEWGGDRQKLDPGKVAQAALVEAKNLGKEGREAYSATRKKETAEYQKGRVVSAIDAIDPKTGAVVQFRRSEENGHYVYNVYDQATGLWLH
ncbi:MAG: hypothetical protein KKH93_06165 [Candidatus Omnitrophica bacterium]|nr:hypothetical protein [Candidatus Omnitrophota bacterium]MBU2044962.1 hypothetical protein [Candidatus Omnitrophota bacterium]MBU2265550.1 hypothetical protein [Candidatus Omnitrophota bacterium]MBU2473552.1 hypothetical protein [Candidatus Omnitrophota bacterium]